jgi:hypothetical protein
MNRQESIPQHNILTLALLLFFLLASLYSLTFSGTFMTDDEHILASRSLSLAFDGQVNNARVYGNSRLYAFSILPKEYSTPAVNVEPAQAILGAGLARWAAALNVGRIHALYLSNIYITALSAVFLFLSIVLLGYSKQTAFLTGMLFGLGTMVWPYSKTYFRDPLAMLFVSLAWTLLLFIKTNQQSKGIRAAAWAGLILAVLGGILSKNTATLLVPVILLDLIVHYAERLSLQNIRQILLEHWKKTAVIGGAVLALVFLWLFVVPGEGMFTRISYDYYEYLITAFLSKPHPGFFRALVGPLVSPGKSIFIYSPVLVLAVMGSVKCRETAWPAWSYLFLLILGQAVFYDDQWWGFIQWGLRYLLPSLPLVMIAAAPAVDRWSKTRPGKTGLLLVGLGSVLIQIIGSLAPVRQYFVEILAADPDLLGAESIWTFSQSAVPWHTAWILEGEGLDLAISRMGVRAVPVILISLITAGLILLALRGSRREWLRYPVLGFSLLLPLAMLFSYRSDPAYFADREDLQAARRFTASSISPGDAVLIKAYNTPVWHHWMNWAGPGVEWIALAAHFPEPNQVEEFRLTGDPEQALDESTTALFRDLPAQYQRTWIVVPQDAPGGSLKIEEAWLSAHYDMVQSEVFSDPPFQTDVTLYRLMTPE